MIHQQDKILYIIRKQKEEKAEESKVVLRMIITFLQKKFLVHYHHILSLFIEHLKEKIISK